MNLLERIKNLEKELSGYRLKTAMAAAEELLNRRTSNAMVEGVKIIYGLVDVESDDELKQVADHLKEEAGSGCDSSRS